MILLLATVGLLLWAFELLPETRHRQRAKHYLRLASMNQIWVPPDAAFSSGYDNSDFAVIKFSLPGPRRPAEWVRLMAQKSGLQRYKLTNTEYMSAGERYVSMKWLGSDEYQIRFLIMVQDGTEVY